MTTTHKSAVMLPKAHGIALYGAKAVGLGEAARKGL